MHDRPKQEASGEGSALHLWLFLLPSSSLAPALAHRRLPLLPLTAGLLDLGDVLQRVRDVALRIAHVHFYLAHGLRDGLRLRSEYPDEAANRDHETVHHISHPVRCRVN